jgi:chromosome segregation ATPase
MYKLCDYTFADRVLETNAEDFVDTKADYNTYATAAATAFGNRQTAQTNINTAQPLVEQRQAELETLNAQKSTLATQKSELETLKNTKAQLQTLYTRVKSIIDQLKQHVASHGTVTQEIANLIAQAQEIQDEIATLELLIISAESDEEILQ